jgi:prepilin-type N-terminal cleavage/methylation domain-containing protein
MMKQTMTQRETIGQQGVTLVEMAVVLAIIGFMLGGLLTPLSMQMDQKRYTDTKNILENAKDALIGYAMSHAATDGRPYLPCPDTNNDGVEETRAGGVCPSLEGRLPWVTLGTAKTDSWGNQIRYRVATNFSNSTTGFTLTTVATLRVCDSSACTTVVASALPAVIISHGKNGYGARSDSGNVNKVPAGASANELANIDGRNFPTAGNNTADTADTADTANVDFVSTFQSDTFDDVVTWISPNILFSRMVSAGRLP